MEIVVDIRKVNENIIDDTYYLPNIADNLDKLGR